MRRPHLLAACGRHLEITMAQAARLRRVMAWHIDTCVMAEGWCVAIDHFDAMRGVAAIVGGGGEKCGMAALVLRAN